MDIKKANYGDKVIRNEPTKSKPLKKIKEIAHKIASKK